MHTGRGAVAWLGLAMGILGACGTEGAPPEVEAPVTATGALVRMEMSSRVGVLLDDIPAGPLREAAAAEALAQADQFWIDRAARQTRLTYYRLVFRGSFYSSDWSNGAHERGPLPLPPKEVWNVELAGRPRRETNPKHDMVVVDYGFETHIVTDEESPGIVEPNLAEIGGTWDESFYLPTDPDLLLERTGFACMDEEEYPPGSVFEENTWYFYDDSCKAGSQWCHLTELPRESCVEAITKHTGIVRTSMHFTRVGYDVALADEYRVGTLTNRGGADLSVVTEGMEEERAIMYRYFAPGSCELEEGVIGQLGWRRLLAFSAIVQNDGTAPVHIGDLTDATNPWLASHVFEFSPCHEHYHFSHYGAFGYNGAPGSKRAFCLEDTNRFHNDEHTPLTAEHQSCQYQGVGAGWGDEYEFGIPGQWVDITEVDTTQGHELTFESNPDEFLCEGTPVLDAAGVPIFDPTDFRDAQGNVVSKMRCDQPEGWGDNNLGSISVQSDGGSFVTEECTRGQMGPLRDCGFTADPTLLTCRPGRTVNLSCTNSGAAQVLRVCEKSAVLATGVACTMRDAASNTMVNGSTNVSFTCPDVRDAPGTGGYSVYTAPVLPSQTGSVSCTGW